MKQFIKAICFTVFLAATPILAIADEITLLADPWCPYTCEESSSKPGYMIEIAQKIFSKAGHTVKYINYDWDEAVADTEKGKFNAVVGAYKEDAPGFVFPEVSQGTAGNVFFIMKDNKWRYNGTNSLPGIKVGTVSGYSYGEALDPVFEKKKKAGEIVESSGLNPLDSLVDKLVDGKIDTIIEDYAVMIDYFVNKGMLDVLNKVISAGEEGEPENVYIAFSPANPNSQKYADILSKGVPELRKSGELAKILKKYEIKDWK